MLGRPAGTESGAGLPDAADFLRRPACLHRLRCFLAPLENTPPLPEHRRFDRMANRIILG